MKNAATISIGIPFLNARRTLADAVRSVFAQTFEDWELLLIDDGSTDGSLDVVRHINDPRVRVLSDGVNRGLCARLNQIASLARGTFLARMDADDLMHPERIAKQLGFLEANPHIDVVDTTAYTIGDDGTPLGMRGEQPLDCAPESVLRKGLLMHPTMTARTQWFRNNPYDDVFVRAEDRELWCRTCSTTKFTRLCEPLFFYREGLSGNLRAYLRTAVTVRKILKIYGPPLIGSWRTTLLIGQSHARSLAYRLTTALGLQGRLIRARNRPLSREEQQAAHATLAQISRTVVPGLAGTPSREEALA